MKPVEVQENVSLQAYNTFGINATARYFTVVQSAGDVQAVVNDTRWKDMPKLILGGGSNMLFTQDFPGLVILNRIMGIEKVHEDEAHVWLRSGSGEEWHKLVCHAISHNLGGIENLSLIPGTVGAAPIQNIGAYGIELKETFDELEAVSLETGELRKFKTEELGFGYRDSFFKREGKGKYFITSVTLKLHKSHTLHLEYGAIHETLEAQGVPNPTISDVSRVVCNIRRSKLPDPKELGNSGSFFKNPEIDEAQYNALKERFPNMPAYPTSPGRVKVPAGWLIEQMGWKGKRVGNTGSHAKQALVLVNYGEATGAEVWQLARQIQESVAAQFGIHLEPEVNVI